MATSSCTIEGCFFELAELRRLRALVLPGIVVLVDGMATGPFEERVLFRLRWAMHLVAATLHKKPDGTFVLTGHDIDEDGSLPTVEAYFDDFDLVLGALRSIFTA